MSNNNWDLHAVVRGCASGGAPPGNTNGNHNYSAIQGFQKPYQDPAAAVPNAGGGGGGRRGRGCANNYNSQAARSSRRKKGSQGGKTTREMTQEQLMVDAWAWRKYGQKPIKGSPYTRHYYRCSTSKGCAARKHVERSPAGGDLFIVSFSGEHTHPRPAIRGLAGKGKVAAGGGRSSRNAAVRASMPMVSASSSENISSAVEQMTGAEDVDVGDGVADDENMLANIVPDEDFIISLDDDEEFMSTFLPPWNGGGGN